MGLKQHLMYMNPLGLVTRQTGIQQVWGGARESAFYQTAGDVSVACTKGLLLCLCLPDIKAAMLSPQIFLPVIYLGSYCGL